MRYIYQNTVQDERGNYVSSASITVYLAGTTTLATIYTAFTGGTADADSVIETGSDGTYSFYVDEDDYPHSQQFKTVMSKPGYTSETWDYLQIFPDTDRTLITDSTADQGDSSIIGTLAWHISDVSGADTVIRILDGNHLVSQTITVPSTMTLKPDHGGIFKDDGGNADLTINGHIEAGIYQIFEWGNGSGAVTFGAGAVRQVPSEWWGSAADGATDSFSAIQAAVDSIQSGEVIFQSGKYISDGEIVVDTIGVILSGGVNASDSWADGSGPIIQGEHTTGSVVRIKKKRCGVKGMRIGATAARIAGAVGTSYGIHLEAVDSSGAAGRPSDCVFEDFTIEDQPSHGFVAVGGIWGLKMERFRILLNDGHGMVFDNGELTSRTNTERPGIMDINLGWLSYNGGHGLVVGTSDANNWGIRMSFRNIDINGNAESAGVRLSTYQAWIRMETSSMSLCAFGGKNIAGDAVVTSGIYFYGGRGVSFKNNRFIEMDTFAINIQGDAGRSTDDVEIDGLWTDQTIGSSLDPAVNIKTSDVNRIRVRSQFQRDVVRLLPVAFTEREEQGVVVSRKTDAETVNDSAVLQNDDTLKISLKTYDKIQFRAVLFYEGNAADDIKIAFTVPNNATLKWSPTGGVRIHTDDSIVVQDVVASSGTAVAFGAATIRMISIDGEVICGDTSGDLQLQWAQNSAGANDTKINGQSYIQATRWE